MFKQILFLFGIMVWPGCSQSVAEPLTIYAPWPEEEIAWVQEQALAAGHTVRFVAGGGGELFDQITNERNNLNADIALGFVDTAMAALKAEGLLVPYEPAWADDLPEMFRDDDDKMIYKFWHTPIVIAYNADALDATEAPQSWLDLVKPEYKDQYVIGSMNSQTTRAYLAGILSRFIDETGDVSADGWNFMRTFFENAVVADDYDSKSDILASGKAVIDLNWLGGALKYGRDLGYEVEIVDAEGGTPFVADGLGILATTDQVKQAQAFVDWFGSAEVMAAYASNFERTPNLPSALKEGSDSERANASSLKRQDLDWDAIAPRLDAWLQTIETEVRER